MIIDVGSILNIIQELGLISIYNQTLTQIIAPQFNVYTADLHPHYKEDRWNITIQYMKDYARYHPEFQGSYFMCLYDGWREMIDPADVEERVYTNWFSYTEQQQQEYFIGKGTINEPRFRSNLNRTQYINLPLQVIAFNRHIGDKNVLLIPDSEFLKTEFTYYKREVISGDISYALKKSQMFWRGSQHVNDGYTYVGEGFEYNLSLAGRSKIHPRELVVNLSSKSPELLNASYERISVEDILKSKYLLDIDGQVSAWSGLYWKLYSNSVVFKLKSHWEQWYYQDLLPYVHYVPLQNLTPLALQKAYSWCEVEQQLCQQIATRATLFARQLTYEYAVKDYIIH